jgi:hypothetical protein
MIQFDDNGRVQPEASLPSELFAYIASHQYIHGSLGNLRQIG